MTREVILERLMRRYAAENTPQSLRACARLLASAPTPEDQNKMLAAFDQGFPAGANFQPAGIPDELNKQVASLWKEGSGDATLIRVMARLGHEPAQKRALELAADSKASVEVRVAMLQLMAELAQPYHQRLLQ